MRPEDELWEANTSLGWGAAAVRSYECHVIDHQVWLQQHSAVSRVHCTAFQAMVECKRNWQLHTVLAAVREHGHIEQGLT
jgi:hypothetical protein